MSYTPTPEPLPGQQWMPSNGAEGYSFLEDACGRCARDKAIRDGEPLDECDDNELCEIIAASFRGEAVEWRQLEDGTVKCISFVKKGEALPMARCDKTVDMFSQKELAQ